MFSSRGFSRLAALPVLATTLALTGCVAPPPVKPGMGLLAAANLGGRSNTKIGGTAQFVQRDGYVEVKVDAFRLEKNKEHGFHIHEKGDCSAFDASSAGGHFNPGNTAHGAHEGVAHAGDMPSLKSDNNGYAHASFKMTSVTLTPGPTSIMGLAVVLHRDPDDFTTQPSGNSGARIGCGIITIP
jgi:superoxide dismutase, Cu-Zn family